LGDYLTLEEDFGTLIVRYGKISKIFFDSITVFKETGQCERTSSRNRAASTCLPYEKAESEN